MARSLSGAWKRPRRSEGATLASSTASFSVESTRRYTSVDFTLAWPSHKATLRTSRVAASVCIAQVCLRTWGDIRLAAIDGQAATPVLTCLVRICSKPERLSGP